jgi:nicotinamide-nucleotide amidase
MIRHQRYTLHTRSVRKPTRMPTALILSQGDEVVTGQVVDTNAAWLAVALTDLGFDVVGHEASRDVRSEIADTVARAARRADVVVSTGGLGPTEDDHTAAAIAEAFARPLVHDPVAMTAIEEMYARFGRRMPEINRKQALLPAGCERLDNDWGTAPGFAVDEHGAVLFFLPGVPREMKAMWTHRVAPRLAERFAIRPGRLVTFRCTGVGESDLQERLGEIDEPGVIVAFRTALPENHVKLRFAAEVSEDRARDLSAQVLERLGTPVFAVEGFDAPGGSLAEVVGRALVERGETLAVAESCTGGRVCAAVTAIPGSSAWFLEGAVTYANAAKVRALGVSEGDLYVHGAVSEPVARAMAEGVRRESGATWGLSVTGVAGPGGGTAEKPVGLVHIAAAGPRETLHRTLRLGGDRNRIQELAAAAVLDLLRREIVSIPSLSST